MLQGQRATGEFLSQNGAQPPLIVLARGGRWRIEQHACTAGQVERDVEPGKCQALHQSNDMPELGRLAAHEAPPCRYIEKKVTHFHRRALRVRDGPDLTDVAAIDAELVAMSLCACARRDPQSRHRADRGQRLAAETEGRDRLEVLQRSDLARGMSADGNRQLGTEQAAAVIADTDVTDAAAPDIDLDAARAGIQAILHQLLDDRSRTLDDLAGRDLVDQLIRKNADG